MQIGIGIRINSSRGINWSPASLSGLVAWWRADAGVTIATGVSSWADQSGGGNTLTQGTGASQPAFEAAGMNGQPTLLFDGSDDFLILSAGTICSLVTGTDKPWSMAMAMEPVTGAANDIWFAWDENGGTSRDLFFEGGVLPAALSHNMVDDASTVAGTSFAAGGVTSGKHIWIITYSGTTTTLYRDGTSLNAISCDVAACTFDRFTLCAQRIGGGAPSGFANNRIAELFFHDHVYTATERAQIDAALRGKYGI